MACYRKQTAKFKSKEEFLEWYKKQPKKCCYCGVKEEYLKKYFNNQNYKKYIIFNRIYEYIIIKGFWKYILYINEIYKDFIFIKKKKILKKIKIQYKL